MSDVNGVPSRGAVWCDRDVALLVTQVARLRGETAREYMRVLVPVLEQHKREAVATLQAEVAK